MKFWPICLTSGDKFVPKAQPSKPNHTQRIPNVLSVRSKHCTVFSVCMIVTFSPSYWTLWRDRATPYGKTVCLVAKEQENLSHSHRQIFSLLAHTQTLHWIYVKPSHTHTHTHPLIPDTPLYPAVRIPMCPLQAVSLPPQFWSNEDQQLPHGAERWIS